MPLGGPWPPLTSLASVALHAANKTGDKTDKTTLPPVIGYSAYINPAKHGRIRPEKMGIYTDVDYKYKSYHYGRSEKSRLSATAVEHGTVADKASLEYVWCVSQLYLSGGGVSG